MAIFAIIGIIIAIFLIICALIVVAMILAAILFVSAIVGIIVAYVKSTINYVASVKDNVTQPTTRRFMMAISIFTAVVAFVPLLFLLVYLLTLIF